MHRIKNRIRNELRCGIVSVFFLAAILVSAHANNVTYADVLVRVQSGVDVGALSHDYNTTVRDSLPGTALYSLYVPQGMSEADFIARLSADGRVVYAEADTLLQAPEGADGNPFHLPFDRTTQPTSYTTQSAYDQVSALGFGSPTSTGTGSSSGSGSSGSGSSGGSGSGSGGSGGGSGYTGGVTGSGVIVAVLDTGVTSTHPALIGHLLPGYNVLSPGSSTDETADGNTNAVLGHGTMVAGIVARMAPGAKILPVRVLNADGVGNMLDIAKGIHYAILAGARVINMSFGTSIRSSVLSDALDDAEQAGVVIVAAAGNNGIEQDMYPASGHGALAVASVESNNQKSDYSNYGSFVRVVAPGSNIESTFWDGGYACWSGTSFATPFVSAEAALLLSAQPSLRADDVVSIIRNTASSVDGSNPNYQGKLGNGLINIQAALSKL